MNCCHDPALFHIGDWQHTAHEVKGRGWSPQLVSDPVDPLWLQVGEWNESAGGGLWRRGRAPSWPDSPRDTPCDLEAKKRVGTSKTGSRCVKYLCNLYTAKTLRSCTCREGHESISPDKFTLLIQEVGRVESVWAFPFALIIQDRSKKRKHCGPL